MTYTPQLVTVSEVRSFFTPSLSSDDISDDELLAKIEAVETYIKDVFFNGNMPTKDTARIPALLLVASQVVQNPVLAKKYDVLVSEKLGDYSYQTASRYSKSYNSWLEFRKMALDILKSKSDYYYVVDRVLGFDI